MGSKKNVLLALASMAVAVIVATATIMSTQASIDFWLEKPASLTQGSNSIAVYCRNGGGMDGDFNLVVKFANATLDEAQTEPPFVKVDDSTVKLKFVLHKGDQANRTIHFNIADNTTGASVTLTLERTSFIQYLFLKNNALYPTQLAYKWNGANGVYNCTDSS